MSTYRQLLNTEEWKNFRLNIIKKDEWTCQLCHNHWINELNHGYFHSVEPYKNSSITHADLYCFIIEFTMQGFILSAFYWTDKRDLFQSIDLDKSTKIFFETTEDDEGQKHNRIVGFKKETNWIRVNNLHVHHTYYQKGLEPWEYPESDLQTLCWRCHEELHENTNVPRYNENGEKIGMLTPCWKCHGARYFPEYFHVQNGVCFGCNGFGYEELKQ